MKQKKDNTLEKEAIEIVRRMEEQQKELISIILKDVKSIRNIPKKSK